MHQDIRDELVIFLKEKLLEKASFLLVNLARDRNGKNIPDTQELMEKIFSDRPKTGKFAERYKRELDQFDEYSAAIKELSEEKSTKI